MFRKIVSGGNVGKYPLKGRKIGLLPAVSPVMSRV